MFLFSSSFKFCTYRILTLQPLRLFVSTNPDHLSWKYVGVLFEGNGSTGTMWECPNFFPIDDKWVLFYGGNSLGYYDVGTYDGSKFTSEKTGLLDAGPDSYAMQYVLSLL